MPCTECDSKLLFFKRDFICPNCRHLSIVSYDDSLQIIQHYIDRHKKIFEKIIEKYQKKELIKGIFWQREKQMIAFNEKYSILDSLTLSSSSVLIRNLFRSNMTFGNEIPDEPTLQKIISIYSSVLDFEEDKAKLMAKNWNMVNLIKYNLNNLDSMPLKDGIRLYENENYGRIRQTFSKHNIMSKKLANKKMKEWSKDYIPIEKGSKKIHSVDETIKTFYDLISMLYVAFLRSKICEKGFQIPHKDLKINPIDIRKLNGKFAMSGTFPSETSFQIFREELITIFKGKYKDIVKNFVISEDNVLAMPLFIKFNETVILSQSFSELYCYFLHAIINEKEFNDETERRSKIFEQEIVKNYFENKNFRYVSNYTRKNKIEIDGIAISDNNIFVIEVKGWKARKLLEEETSKELLTREIKSAITGFKITNKNKQIKHKRSLNEKVKWVSENRAFFRINKNASVTGLLIINESPTLQEYLGCKILFIDEMEYMRNIIHE